MFHNLLALFKLEEREVSVITCVAELAKIKLQEWRTTIKVIELMDTVILLTI